MRLDKLPFQLHERYIFQFIGVSQECSETMSGSLKFRRNRQFANELRNRSVDGVPPHAGSFTVPDRTGLRKRFSPINSESFEIYTSIRVIRCRETDARNRKINPLKTKTGKSRGRCDSSRSLFFMLSCLRYNTDKGTFPCDPYPPASVR